MKIFLPFLLTLLLLLNSCGIYKKTDARKIPTNSDERIAKNISEGKALDSVILGKKNLVVIFNLLPLTLCGEQA